jgi:hypothetical protein
MTWPREVHVPDRAFLAPRVEVADSILGRLITEKWA